LVSFFLLSGLQQLVFVFTPYVGSFPLEPLLGRLVLLVHWKFSCILKFGGWSFGVYLLRRSEFSLAILKTTAVGLWCLRLPSEFSCGAAT
jgi:hypothetical protein